MGSARARLAGTGLAILAAVSLAAAQPRTAAAAPADDARVYNDKATAAFALGRFAEAADHFEKAFELKPEAALLYNAAQAHRLAGNKERALTLYQSYLRVYGNKDKRSEVEARIRDLTAAIAKDKQDATRPPTTTEPVTVAPALATPPPTPAPAPPPEPPAAPAPVVAVTAAPPPPEPPAVSLVAQPAPPEERSVTSSPWFWIAIGGAVVATVAVTLLLVVKKDPDASIGVVP
jgi:tetratricopeptide (TPR) repeat protein